MTTKYPHYISIEWGSESWRNEEDPDNLCETTYKFATRAELVAFMNGVFEAEGWMGCEVTEDSRDDCN